jgi:UDP-glucose 4-epimerase
MARVLITGLSGSLSQLVADRLLEEGHEVIGVDYRPKKPGTPRAITFYQANYNKRLIEDVFRRHQPEWVLHLGRVGNLKTTANKRFDLNVVGSAKIMELSVQYGVDRLVVMSTFHIYGAHAANHIPIFEDEPLRAGQGFPQLADAVQADSQALTWVYRHRKLRTVVLRPTNIVGPHIQNAISTYLRSGTQAYLLGYSPMWQFVHELDMVDAILLAAKGKEVGVFNVAGRGEIPLIRALSLTGATLIPVPAPIAFAILQLGGGFTIPPYFLDFFKYPCIVSDARFRTDFGYEPHVGIEDAIESTVRAMV